jgi:hypothetical protein
LPVAGAEFFALLAADADFCLNLCHRSVLRGRLPGPLSL